MEWWWYCHCELFSFILVGKQSPPPTILAPGTGIVEYNFFMAGGGVGVVVSG